MVSIVVRLSDPIYTVPAHLSTSHHQHSIGHTQYNNNNNNNNNKDPTKKIPRTAIINFTYGRRNKICHRRKESRGPVGSRSHTSPRSQSTSNNTERCSWVTFTLRILRIARRSRCATNRLMLCRSWWELLFGGVFLPQIDMVWRL